MCVRSIAKIKGKPVKLYMGYYNGYMDVGGLKYVQEDKPETPPRWLDTYEAIELSKEDFIDYLCKFKKKELATLITDLINNSDED